MTKKLPLLVPGDVVDIIAPASRIKDVALDALITCLEAWQLQCVVSEPLLGDDLFCANTDAMRLQHLQQALLHSESKAIIAARGGYGSMRLIPALQKLPTPSEPKIFIGMSDITALHLFFQQKWQWPTIHGAIAPNNFSEESHYRMQKLLFKKDPVCFSHLVPLNKAAEKEVQIKASIIGGNLSLVQASMGTPWQLDGAHKIILLEEVGERGYRIDRMLEQLKQAAIFEKTKAILFGDYTKGLEPDGSSLIEATLKRFADACPIPVLRITGIGHDYSNLPIPLGVHTELILGKKAELICVRC